MKIYEKLEEIEKSNLKLSYRLNIVLYSTDLCCNSTSRLLV